MNTTSRTERALKDLDVLAQTVKTAALLEPRLEEKVKYHRAAKTLEQARSSLRLLIFLLEDAGKLADNAAYCPQCGALDLLNSKGGVA